MTDDPRGFADGDSAEPDPLNPEEEAAVRVLLAALPDPELPTDVERRIVAAVGATTAGLATGPTPAPGPATPAPPGDGSRGHRAAAAPRSPSGGWRRPWLLQSAALLVIVALVGAVAVGFTRGGGGDDAPKQLVLSQDEPGPVTVSGRTYTAANLSDQVQGLVSGSMPAASSSDEAGAAASAAGGTPSAAGSGEAAAASLVENPASRQRCIDELASVAGAKAVAIDVGTFDGKPAAVFVLPDEDDATKVAAWVVGPTCSNADNPFPYRYERVARP